MPLFGKKLGGGEPHARVRCHRRPQPRQQPIQRRARAGLNLRIDQRHVGQWGRAGDRVGPVMDQASHQGRRGDRRADIVAGQQRGVAAARGELAVRPAGLPQHLDNVALARGRAARLDRIAYSVELDLARGDLANAPALEVVAYA
jgi:hypothetical protein